MPVGQRTRHVGGEADAVGWWRPRQALDAATADAVVTSLVLHHLDLATKQRALGEMRRVLRPGARLHIADWGRPATALLRAPFFVLQVLDGFAGTRDHAAGRIPAIVRAAGFGEVSAREFRSGSMNAALTT